MKKKKKMDEIEKKNPKDLIDHQAQMVVDFLEQIGLPKDNIIAAQSERTIVGKNLKRYIESNPQQIF